MRFCHDQMITNYDQHYIVHPVTELPSQQISQYSSLSLCCFMTTGLSKDIRYHVWPYSFLCLQRTNCKSNIESRSKMISQPGDWWWPQLSSSGFLVGMYGQTYSLYHSRGWKSAPINLHVCYPSALSHSRASICRLFCDLSRALLYNSLLGLQIWSANNELCP